jgi:hypothetical protein
VAAVTIATLGCLFGPPRTEAQTLTLEITNGGVTLLARDVSIRDILRQWAHISGTHIVNLDAAPADRVSLQLSDVPERQAMSVLLRDVGGYILGTGWTAVGTPRIERVFIVPLRSVTPAHTGAATAAASSTTDDVADIPQTSASTVPDAPFVLNGSDVPNTPTLAVELEASADTSAATFGGTPEVTSAATGAPRAPANIAAQSSGAPDDGLAGYLKVQQELLRKLEQERAATPFGAGAGTERPGEISPVPQLPGPRAPLPVDPASVK